MATTDPTLTDEEDTKKKPFGSLLGDGTPDLYSGLNTGIDKATQAAYDTVGSQISGAAYDPYKTSANEALQTAAKNLRAQTSSQYTPNLGQGAAAAAEAGTEQNVMSQLSTTLLGEQQGEEQMKNQGISNYNTLQNLSLSERQQTQSEAQQAYADAITAKDPKAAAEAYSRMYPGATLDTAQLQKDIANSNTLTGQQITAGSLGLTSTQFQGVSSMVNSGATLDQINQAYGTTLTQAQYDSMAAMYQSTLGTSNTNLAGLQQKLGSDKYNAIQNMVNTGATVDQINAQYGAGTLTADQYTSMKGVAGTTLQWATLAQNATLTQAGIASGEKIAGMNISSNQTIAAMQIASAQSLAKDSNYLTQQGIDLQKASVQGYTDASGNHVMGSAEIAAQSFGLQTKTVQDTENALYGTTINGQWVSGSLQNMSDTQKQQAAALYGYTDPVTGQHVAGSLEIANDSNAIQKQGMDNATAALKGYIDANGNYVMGTAGIAAQTAGLQVDELKGYTDTNGNHVAGSLELAQKQFGLQSATLDLQTKEVMGYTDASGYHAGSIANADAATQLQMYGMYGYALDNNGNKVAIGSSSAVKGTEVQGSMALQADQVDIQKQGLTLQTAQLEGYDKTDPSTGKVTHVNGSLESAAATLDLQSKAYQDQHTELFGGWDATANGGKGAWVNGSISNLDATQQNQAYSLYGYALDSKGNKVAIGDPSAVAGSTVQGSLSIAYSNATASQEATRASINSTNQATASATYWDASKKVETFAQTNLPPSGGWDFTSSDPSKNPMLNTQFQATMANWYTQQTGNTAPANNDPTYVKWVQGELSAAQDNRLTNPIDQTLYEINNSTDLTADQKAQFSAVFNELPAGTTFSIDKNGVLQAFSSGDTSSPTSFGGSNGPYNFNPSTSGAAAGFTSAGAMWTSSNKTTQGTSPIGSGEAITLQSSASIQNSSIVIPNGNYYGIDSTHIQTATPNADGNYLVYDTTGKTYPVATKTAPSQAALDAVNAGLSSASSSNQSNNSSSESSSFNPWKEFTNWISKI